jgi:hypothetical protein
MRRLRDALPLPLPTGRVWAVRPSRRSRFGRRSPLRRHVEIRSILPMPALWARAVEHDCDPAGFGLLRLRDSLGLSPVDGAGGEHGSRSGTGCSADRTQRRSHPARHAPCAVVHAERSPWFAQCQTSHDSRRSRARPCRGLAGAQWSAGSQLLDWQGAARAGFRDSWLRFHPELDPTRRLGGSGFVDPIGVASVVRLGCLDAVRVTQTDEAERSSNWTWAPRASSRQRRSLQTSAIS